MKFKNILLASLLMTITSFADISVQDHFNQDQSDGVYLSTTVNEDNSVERTIVSNSGTWSAKFDTNKDGLYISMEERVNNVLIRSCQEFEVIKSNSTLLKCDDKSEVEIYFSKEDEKLINMIIFYDHNTIEMLKTSMFGDDIQVLSDYRNVVLD